MITLEKFLEPIKLANTPLCQTHRAYRMDGNTPQPDMRKNAGLGTCNCCDYFMPYNDDSVLLIEETQLIQQIKDLKREYRYLKSAHQKHFIDKYIKQENRVKAYGSMLVLCRLAAVCKDARDLLGTKKYKFWIVDSSAYSTKDAKFFRNLKHRLFLGLKEVLSGKIVDDVIILPSCKFVTKLSEQSATP